MVAIPGADWPLVLVFAQERHAGAWIVRNDHDRSLRATGRGVPEHEPYFRADRRVAGEVRGFSEELGRLSNQRADGWSEAIPTIHDGDGFRCALPSYALTKLILSAMSGVEGAE